MWGWKNHLFPWLYLEENEGSVFFPCENLLVRTICTCKYIPCTCAVSLVRTIVHLLCTHNFKVWFVRATCTCEESFCSYKAMFCTYNTTVYSCSCQSKSREFFHLYVQTNVCMYNHSFLYVQGVCFARGNAKLYVRTRTNFSREYCLYVTIFTMSGSQ